MCEPFSLHLRARPLYLLLVFVCLVSLSCTETSEESPEPRTPNFLIIVTDDQPPGSMFIMDDTRRLFDNESTVYSQAFVTTPLCCPSRASMFSGQYAHNHGVTSNYKLDEALAFDQQATIQRHLKRAGYLTGVFGKYLNSWDIRTDPPHFDAWAIFAKSNKDSYRVNRWNIGGQMQSVDMFSTDYIARRAVRFIRRGGKSERPWILFVFPAAPHKPFIPAPRDIDATISPSARRPARAEKDLSDKPDYVRKWPRVPGQPERIRTKQLRTLLGVDSLVADINSALSQTGQKDETAILFSSDNGYLWGEHGLVRKGFPYTRSIKVPLMVKWPEGIDRPPAVDDRLVTNVDIAPTIFELAGLRGSFGAVDGRSLLRTEGHRTRVFIEYFSEPYFPIPRWESIRAEDFQYVEYYDSRGEVTFREFYDLSEDPRQLNNLLAEDHPRNDPNVRLLSRWLVRARSCRGDDCP